MFFVLFEKDHILDLDILFVLPLLLPLLLLLLMTRAGGELLHQTLWKVPACLVLLDMSACVYIYRLFLSSCVFYFGGFDSGSSFQFIITSPSNAQILEISLILR